MVNINNILVKIDKAFDYIPVVSTFSNIANIFNKCVVLSFKDKQSINANHYYTHLKNKTVLRCVILLVPFIGNIIIVVCDFLNRKSNEYYFSNFVKMCNETKIVESFEFLTKIKDRNFLNDKVYPFIKELVKKFKLEDDLSFLKNFEKKSSVKESIEFIYSLLKEKYEIDKYKHLFSDIESELKAKIEQIKELDKEKDIIECFFQALFSFPNKDDKLRALKDIKNDSSKDELLFHIAKAIVNVELYKNSIPIEFLEKIKNTDYRREKYFYFFKELYKKDKLDEAFDFFIKINDVTFVFKNFFSFILDLDLNCNVESIFFVLNEFKEIYIDKHSTLFYLNVEGFVKNYWKMEK